MKKRFLKFSILSALVAICLSFVVIGNAATCPRAVICSGTGKNSCSAPGGWRVRDIQSAVGIGVGKIHPGLYHLIGAQDVHQIPNLTAGVICDYRRGIDGVSLDRSDMVADDYYTWQHNSKYHLSCGYLDFDFPINPDRCPLKRST